ncbi:hypothetical protein [Agrococcus beijingensis]|uniref:hypothetical protein n=1 Tax=Agrococcus beijingensis TaxID=3068634 RepID=UPI00274283A2|nr:hypothetical protein [Agrococcus sp. REN33]
MPSPHQPDLRPLEQPLTRADLRAMRRWLRQHRQPRDLPSIGLAFGGWTMAAVGGMILLASIGRDEDPAMPVVATVMIAIGVGLLLYRGAARRLAMRRAARMLRFATDNGYGFAHRALLDPKPASALHQGFDHLALDVLQDADGAEWGLWRHRLDVRTPFIEVGYVELPWSAAMRELPSWLAERLARAATPLHAEVHGERLTVVARRGWDPADPAVQQLVHWIRSLAFAATSDLTAPQPAPTAHPNASAALIASTAAGRRQRRASLGFAAIGTLVFVAGAFVLAINR